MTLLSIGSPMQLLLIVLIILIIFGGSKLPQLMRGAGRGIREFKDAMDGKDIENDKKSETTDPKKEEK